MTKSYSIDLRERVIAHIEEGHTCRAAARAFNVSASFAVKLVSRWRATGSPALRGKAVHRGAVNLRLTMTS